MTKDWYPVKIGYLDIVEHNWNWLFETLEMIRESSLGPMVMVVEEYVSEKTRFLLFKETVYFLNETDAINTAFVLERP